MTKMDVKCVTKTCLSNELLLSQRSQVPQYVSGVSEVSGVSKVSGVSEVSGNSAVSHTSETSETPDT